MRYALVLLLVLTTTLLPSCARDSVVNMDDPSWRAIVSKHKAHGGLEKPFQIEVREFQLLVEQAITARASMQKVLSQLRRTDHDAPLEPAALKTIREGTEYYLDLRKALREIAERYECMLDVRSASLKHLEALADGGRYAFQIAPLLRTKMVMLSLSAALVLYDNYLTAIVYFNQDDRLRRLINSPDSGFGIPAGALTELCANANSVVTRARLRRGIEFYEEEARRLAGSKEDAGEMRRDQDYAYLDLLLNQSPSYSYVKQVQIGRIAESKLDELQRITWDTVSASSADLVHGLSEMFGNTVGLVESRKGKLWQDQDADEHLTGILRPLDILLEKTPFRLTDKFIPGHFGHVAIWVGTSTDLRQCGVWNEPEVGKHHASIKSHRSVLEALRSGVDLNTLDEFMNVDDVAILRPTDLGPADGQATRDTLVQAFRQVGKLYDFNFDVETTDKIVCSELVYTTFTTIRWPTERTLGRHTISPDHVARKALAGGPLRLIALYHDGERVRETEQLALMRELLTKQ